MKRFFFATLILLSSGIGTAWAYRVIEQTEDSYELALAEVSLPRGQPGFVRFRIKTVETCRDTIKESKAFRFRSTNKTSHNYFVLVK